MSEQTAYQIAQRQMRYAMLARNAEIQAEIIAQHYASLASIALQVVKLIEVRRHTGHHPEVDYCVDGLIDEMKRRHLQDLGIPLEWDHRLK